VAFLTSMFIKPEETCAVCCSVYLELLSVTCQHSDVICVVDVHKPVNGLALKIQSHGCSRSSDITQLDF
jgi:hypothetical protein